jgi:ABC-type polysaccharide/polyol phosphate export permease
MIGILLLLLICLVFTGRLTLFTPMIIVYLFFIAIFSIGLGWMLSSINVYLRDIQQMVGLIMMGWMFFTPVFYSPAIIPAKYLLIMKLNPMYHMIEGYRYAVLAGRILPAEDIAYLGVVSLVMFVIGGMFFRRLKPGFAEVL